MGFWSWLFGSNERAKPVDTSVQEHFKKTITQNRTSKRAASSAQGIVSPPQSNDLLSPFNPINPTNLMLGYMLLNNNTSSAEASDTTHPHHAPPPDNDPPASHDHGHTSYDNYDSGSSYDGGCGSGGGCGSCD